MVPKLQSILLNYVPTEQIIEHNLTHLYGSAMRRFAEDMVNCKQPITQWFLCLLFDTGSMSYFSFYNFIHRKAHRLPLNKYMFIGYQEYIRQPHSSLEMFAVRTDLDKVIIFVYTNPNDVKNGYPSRRVIPSNLSGLKLESVFLISSPYDPHSKRKKPYDELFGG